MIGVIFLSVFVFRGLDTSEVLYRSRRQFLCNRNELQCRDGSCIPFDGDCNDSALGKKQSVTTFGSGTAKCTFQDPFCTNSNGNKDIKGEIKTGTFYVDNEFGQTPDIVTSGSKPATSDVISNLVPPKPTSEDLADVLSIPLSSWTDSGGIGPPSPSPEEPEISFSPGKKSCKLPQYPENGSYEVADLPNARPGQSLDSFVLTLRCSPGYGVVGIDSGNVTMYCVNGIWSKAMPECVRFCRLEQDPSVRYMCREPGVDWFSPCKSSVAPGTSVNPVCNSPIYYSDEGLFYMKCTAGSWDYVARCKPDCGRVTPEGGQLVIGGTSAKRGELPWHAGVYTKVTSPYMQICGGSLISNNVIISAAHCFWKEPQKQLPASRFAVAVGKLHRPWNNEKDTDAQKSDVRDIKLPKLFHGSETNLQEDIAVVIVASPFVYKTYIRPVCLSFNKDFDRRQLQHGKLGKVAGWGLTAANGKASPVLKVVEMPYINLETCFKDVPRSFRETITSDKFCAGYINRTALCRGDSGGGLAFPSNTELDIERYYLRGVVSAAPTDDDKLCNDAAYTAFTRVIKHEEFIKEYLQVFKGN